MSRRGRRKPHLPGALPKADKLPRMASHREPGAPLARPKPVSDSIGLYEPSVWMRKAAERRIRDADVQQARQAHSRRFTSQLVPNTGDRDCDRCGLSVPEGDNYCLVLLPVELSPTCMAGLTVGLCSKHALAEFPGLTSGQVMRLRPLRPMGVA